MAFDWNGYIDLADFISNNIELFIKQNEEACCRAAISRAYYGVYGQALKYAQKNGVNLQGTGKDHKLVKEYFLHNSDVNKRRIGFWLQTLHQWRKESDYNELRKINVGDSKAKVEQAKKALNLIMKLS